MVALDRHLIQRPFGDRRRHGGQDCLAGPHDPPTFLSSPFLQSEIRNPKSEIARPLQRAGFTLIELLAIMAIMVILFGIAAAASVHWGRAARMRSSVQKIHASLGQARQWTVTHHIPTAFVLGNDFAARRGYFSLTNASQGIIGITNYLAGGAVWTNSMAPVLFLPDGTVDSPANRELIVTELDKGSAALINTITIYRVTGHVQTSD